MANQITKDFQMKSKLRKLADGGSRGEGGGFSKEAVMAAIAAQRGAPTFAPAPAPTPAPAPVAVQRPGGDYIRNPRSVLAARERAAGLADGGSAPFGSRGLSGLRDMIPQMEAMGFRQQPAQPDPTGLRAVMPRVKAMGYMDGGRVEGPGGRTDDEVGPVMLSDEEYVLPGDTADAIGRDKLDAIRLATHDFKDERKESKLRKAHGLADGGSPWIADAAGNVRKPNAFGDAAAGPNYTQPKLPPPQTGTAVQVAQPQMGQRPPINMGMVDEVPRQSPSRAYQVGNAVGRTAPVVGRVVGGLAPTAPLAGFGDYKADTGGIDTSATGTLGYLAKGEFGNAGTSLSGGAGEALADSGRGVAKTVDTLAGIFGANPNLTGKYDAMISDKLGGYLSLRNQEIAGPISVQAKTAAATSPLRSDQGPALPVEPDSYQSRRLSEMGVPLDVQNSKPIVDSALRGTQGVLKTGGTSQYQNLGSYGGNGNIYGKADDPSRPGRINNFVGVGAGASPENEANGSGSGGGGYAGRGGVPQSPLRSSSAPSGGSSVPGVDAAVNAINARYDRMLKEGRGRSVEFGSDWSQRHGISLETARGRELNELLGNARTNETSRANAQLAADTSRKNAELNARTNLETARNTLEGKTRDAKAKVVSGAISAMGEDAKTADARTGRALSDLNGYTERMFGKDTPKGRDFERAFRVTNPEFFTMPDAERAAMLPQVHEQLDAQSALRQRASTLGRPSGIGIADVDGTPREIRFGDWVNDKATFGDWMESHNFFGDNDKTAVHVPNSDMYVSRNALTKREDGSSRSEVVARLSEDAQERAAKERAAKSKQNKQ